MVDDQEFRCRRAERCTARVTLQDPVTGDNLGQVGAALSGKDQYLPKLRGRATDRDPVRGDLHGLCPTCVIEVDTALAHLVLDVRELSMLLPRALTGSSAERGEITRPAPGPLLPLQERVYALQELIDHEVTAWAEVVSRVVGDEWDSDQMQHTRVGHRVQEACAVLRGHLAVLLALPPQEYRAQSTTDDPADGHDEDVTTRRGRVVWTSRDGVQAALVLLGLHRAVWTISDRDVDRPDQLRMPCRNRACHQIALRHWPGDDTVLCVACGHRSKWEDYDVLRSRIIGVAAG